MRVKFVRYFFLKITILTFLAISGASHGEDGAGKIFIEVGNIKNTNGMLRALLFNSHDGFPGEPSKAIKTTSSNITSDKMTLIFSGVPSGVYAVSVIHDENSNSKMDYNFLGIPKEGYCFSNNAAGIASPPRFEDAKFKFASDDKTSNSLNLSLRMRY